MHWTEEFFDDYYLKSIDKITGAEQTNKEVDFVLSNIEISKDSPIMDLACGHGRHAINLAERGFSNITGLDLTSTYIELARQKSREVKHAPKFINEDMKNFEESNSYSLIFSLFTSMFYFSDTHNLDILQRVYKALKREGYFIVDYFNPPSFLKSAKKKDWYFTEDDSVILEKFSHNPISGIITNERMIITPDGTRVKRVYHVRDYTVAELRYHFENIGFEVLDVYGNFDGDKYDLDSPRQIYIMRKPE